MAAYIRIDKASATVHLESVVHDAPLANGQFVNFKELDPDLGGEAVKVEMATEGTAPEGFMATVIVDQGWHNFDYKEFTLDSGKVGRAYHLEDGQVVSVLAEMVTGDPVEGDDLAVGIDGFGFKKAEGADIVVGKFIGADYLNYIGDLAVVRIVK